MPNFRNDTATDEDLLGFEPYVDAIAEFLTDKDTLPPITLSIEGQWGCGKSSFMRQLEKKIKEKKKFTVWFNPWKYDKEDELWACFVLYFIDQLSAQLSWRLRQLAKIKLIWLRLKFKWKNNNAILLHIISRVIFVLIILALWVLVILSIPKLMDSLFSHSTGELPSVSPFTDPIYFLLNLISPSNNITSANPKLGNISSSPNLVDYRFMSSINVLLMLAGIIGLLLQIFYLFKEIKGFVGNPFDFNKFVSNPNYREYVTFREYFHSDFNKVIESYVKNSKVYVFIDDLDRCEVPKAAELMQAINLMIPDNSKVYFILGIDRKAISAGFAAKNEKVIDFLGVDGITYGYEFIEKFIQLPFKVPNPKDEKLKLLISSHCKKKRSSDTSNFFVSKLMKTNALVNRKKQKVMDQKKTPEEIYKEKPVGQKKKLNIDDCKEFSEKDKISNDFENIIKMVAPTLDRNPRRIIQFLNLFRFQRTIGLNTDLFSYDEKVKPNKRWNCKKLAKFVAISIKWPSLISALTQDETLLSQLQEYALRPEKKELEEEKKIKGTKGNFFEAPWALTSDFKSESEVKSEGKNEEKKKQEEEKKLGTWVKDEKLIELLRIGCVEDKNFPKNEEEYSLSNLNLSKLLEISPVTTLPFEPPIYETSKESISDRVKQYFIGSKNSYKTLENIRVKDIMTRNVVSVSPSMSVEDLVRFMFEKRHMGYPVMEGDSLKGIVTFTDIQRIPSVERPMVQVSDIMTMDVISVSPDTQASDVFKLIKFKNIGRVVVVDNGSVVGIISRTDFVRILKLRSE